MCMLLHGNDPESCFVSDLLSLANNLVHQLSGWGNNDRLKLMNIDEIFLRTSAQDVVDGRNQETNGLSTSCRSNGEKVDTSLQSILVLQGGLGVHEKRQTAHLDLSRDSVSLKDEVVGNLVVETVGIAKLAKRIQRLREELLLVFLLHLDGRLLLFLALLDLGLILGFRKQCDLQSMRSQQLATLVLTQ
ncbi:hypothetical protein HG530_004495 [Fusarium avenaceum]|nr:hypothetical protein HG530_004495 [Fusarium avenaceum]